LTTSARVSLRRAYDRFLPLGGYDPRERRALDLFLLDGLLIAFGAAFVGTFIPLYALAMGATAVQVGLLTSLGGGVAIVGSLLSAPAVKRFGGSQRVALFFSRYGDGLPLALLIAVPLFWHGPGAVAVLLIGQSIRGLISNVGGPAWAAFTAEIVPLEMRGRYMAVRNSVKVVATVVGVPLAGFLIAGLGGYPWGYQVSFALAIGLECWSGWIFGRIPAPMTPADPPLAATAASAPRLGRLARMRRELAPQLHGPFGRFLLTNTVWGVASAISAPFYIIFMTRNLHLGAEAIGLLTAFTTGAQLIGYMLLGPIADRRGNYTILCASALLAAVIPLGWLWVRVWWQILPLYLLTGFSAAGFANTNFNLMLELCPEEGRASYMGTTYTLAAIAATIAPLVGGYLFSRSGFSGTLIVTGAASLVAALLWVILLRPTKMKPPQMESV
jgi:MFS family permease